MRLPLAISIIGLLIGCLSCKKVPDGVIHPDDMAELMADIHIGEAVIDANYSEYMTDSTRMLLKQSILAKHGLTTADLDTSLVWYGGHLDMMQDIYEHTAEILEQRVAGGSGNQRGQVGASGISIDSTDMWPGNSWYLIRPSSPSSTLVFSLNSDQEWKPGDSFTLRGYFTNNNSPTKWHIIAQYADGTIESISNRFSGNGRHQIVFHTDSTKVTKKIFGSIDFDQGDAKLIFADSLSLVRKPLDTQAYSQRYRQRSELFFNRNQDQKHDEE